MVEYSAKLNADSIVIDVGIFAHNEDKTIGNLVNELANQDILDDPKIDIQINIIANGCHDNTVQYATETLAQLPENRKYRIKVLDCEQKGKSRAVHRFIHKISRTSAKFLIFMDADIHLPRTTLLSQMVDQINSRAEVLAFSSRPVKDVTHFKMATSAITRVIAAGGNQLGNDRTSICGQLFILRATTARQIGLPVGLPVEDGFMRAMILTNLLSEPENIKRIDADPDIFHIYESIRGMRELIQHQIRIVVGSAVNTALFTKIRREAPTQEAAYQMLMESADNENWLSQVLKQELPKAPYGYVPFSFLTKRIKYFDSRKAPGLKKYLMLGVGVGLDCVVYIGASIRMMLRQSSGFW